ncbi:hypothetical protein M407DRAFT_242372 [Tulasnella calospora MUT 4182]|uniref:Uncharacterized protein n=1 Tax=Tulasnella calospora MUT 4182 TaxID=1051891 RepID=A0A0C3M8I9_9AGAM|nr:hypothetical protein M407DRAFT_242372 [Tulasnella calospora MUT 4182]
MAFIVITQPVGDRQQNGEVRIIPSSERLRESRSTPWCIEQHKELNGKERNTEREKDIVSFRRSYKKRAS